MASAAGKWELVKKGKKSNNSKSQEQEKNTSRRALREANVTHNDTSRVMSETIYDGFEKMAKKQNKEQVPPAADLPLKKPNTGKQIKKPAVGNSGATHYKTLEEAVKALNIGELKQQLEKSQNLFPENPSIWVKDLAGYLNYKLQAPDTDPTLSSYTHDYPYCLAGKELKAIIKNLMSKCSDSLADFFDHCLYTMLKEQDRQPAGESLHGYRMCIQALMLDKPKIATMNLPAHLELLRSHQSRPVKCLTIMWGLGQAGFYDLSQGIRVWLSIMLPVLGIKSLSAYAIAYLERLLTLHANLTKGFGIIGPKEFFPLLDFAYMPKNALSSSLQEQLCRLYPRLKVLAFGAKPESTLHTYFPSFLSRATPNCPDAMKTELLNSLLECLSVDDQTLSVWRQLYTKHLPQSSLLLDHLLKVWNTLSPKLRKNLQDTIQSFRVTNEELQTSTKTQEIRDCNSLCQSLQVKMRGQSFPWWRVIMMMLVFVVGFIAHDIRTQGSFTNSTTALYLERSGVTALSQQAWSKVSVYSQQVVSWMKENTPYYYSRAVETVGPLLEDGQEKIKMAVVFIAHKSSDVLAWLRENVPLLIEWINANTPDSVFQFIEYLKELLLYIQEQFIVPSLQYLSTAIQHAWKSLQDSCNGEVTLHCLQDHLKTLTNITWIYLQDATSAMKSRAQDLLSRA